MILTDLSCLGHVHWKLEGEIPSSAENVTRPMCHVNSQILFIDFARLHDKFENFGCKVSIKSANCPLQYDNSSDFEFADLINGGHRLFT